MHETETTAQLPNDFISGPSTCSRPAFVVLDRNDVLHRKTELGPRLVRGWDLRSFYTYFCNTEGNRWRGRSELCRCEPRTAQQNFGALVASPMQKGESEIGESRKMERDLKM